MSYEILKKKNADEYNSARKNRTIQWFITQQDRVISLSVNVQFEIIRPIPSYVTLFDLQWDIADVSEKLAVAIS